MATETILNQDLTYPDELMHPENYPKYEYTFKVTNLYFEAGTIEVEYTPTNTKLTKVSFCLPVPPTFDNNDMASFVELFAPHYRWFAQEKMLGMTTQ